MSYFIFKDIHSDDMNITVESLPSIVKPPKRYDIIEIDGRDRVDIEVLGYKAYEKMVMIGFKNECDIWQAIDWLDGQGSLILSNELDKYYDAYVLEQIDFERTLRFRKASVSFLVQPYKHATGEEETTSRVVFNRGNVEARPIMTIYGNGAVDVLINGIKACTVTINEYITLDSDKMEAYKGSTLQNRLMIGDFPLLKPGENIISFNGNVTQVKTLVRSRWL